MKLYEASYGLVVNIAKFAVRCCVLAPDVLGEETCCPELLLSSGCLYFIIVYDNEIV
jgi:hypothetical protein